MPMPPKKLTSRDGREFTLRPIRPSDAPSMIRGYDMLTDEAKWFRMLHAVPHLTEEMAVKLCSPAPERDICLVLEADDGSDDIIGGARLMGDGDDKAEFAVSMRPDAQGLGLARKSLQAALDLGRERGIRHVWGQIAARNTPMLKLSKRLGFAVRPDPEERGMMIAEIELDPPGSATI